MDLPKRALRNIFTPFKMSSIGHNITPQIPNSGGSSIYTFLVRLSRKTTLLTSN